jgi:hypothetical protein
VHPKVGSACPTLGVEALVKRHLRSLGPTTLRARIRGHVSRRDCKAPHEKLKLSH